MKPTFTMPDDSAFPMFMQEILKGSVAHAGLTKREYFAAMAMQGILASSPDTGSYSTVAETAVEQADALIDLLNEEDS